MLDLYCAVGVIQFTPATADKAEDVAASGAARDLR
jgi:hypothetical protein